VPEQGGRTRPLKGGRRLTLMGGFASTSVRKRADCCSHLSVGTGPARLPQSIRKLNHRLEDVRFLRHTGLSRTSRTSVMVPHPDSDRKHNVLSRSPYRAREHHRECNLLSIRMRGASFNFVNGIHIRPEINDVRRMADSIDKQHEAPTAT